MSGAQDLRGRTVSPGDQKTVCSRPPALAGRETPRGATATFWLETLLGQSEPTQPQYSQIVLLNFNTLSWPHVTVGTLTKAK